MSWDSSVGIVTSCGLGGQGSIPCKGKRIYLFSIASRPGLGPTQPPIQWVLVALSQGVKQMGREADQSLPSSAKLKNSGTISPLPIHLHGII
jgi:hypothetical protein